MRTALDADKSKPFVTIIHPFHPLRGQRFELIDCQRRWGQWRVCYLAENGEIAYAPAGWTDVGPRDPFLEQSQGRAIARPEDLLELVKIMEKGCQ